MTANQTQSTAGDRYKIMTYNVLLFFTKEGRDPNFPVDLVESVLAEAPDILGTQETTAELQEKCLKNLTGYTCFIGEVYHEELRRGNYIYLKDDKFNVIEMGHRFMSDTPTVRSKYEKSREYRGFNYLFLEDKNTASRLLFLNLHADYRADEDTRVLQLKAVNKFLMEERWAGIPAVIVGDFNSTAGQASIPTFLSDNPRLGMTSEIAEVKGDTGPTLIGGGFTEKIPYVFDYIFVTKDLIDTKYYSVIDNIKNGKYPSDHLPVVAEIELPKNS